jgi:hypothetical protein
LHVLGGDGTWATWSLEGLHNKPVTQRLGVGVNSAVTSHDGRALATVEEAGGDQSLIHLWSVETGKALCQPLQARYHVRRLSFNHDGTRLVAACSDALLEPRPALQWEIPSGKKVDPPLWHEDGVLSVACHPKDGRVITGGEDSLVRVWDPRLPRPLIAEQRMGYQVLHVTFSEDGELFAAASVDGTARVWDSETGEPITPVLRHPALVWRVWFTASAQKLVTLCNDGRAYVWDIGPMAGTPDELRNLADLLAGDSDPGTAGLAAPAGPRAENWAAPLPVAREAIAAWHREEASLCEKAGQNDLTLVHLGKALAATPDSWWLHWRRALLLAKMGRNEDACGDLRESLRLDPDCAAARERLESLERIPGTNKVAAVPERQERISR